MVFLNTKQSVGHLRGVSTSSKASQNCQEIMIWGGGTVIRLLSLMSQKHNVVSNSCHWSRFYQTPRHFGAFSSICSAAVDNKPLPTPTSATQAADAGFNKVASKPKTKTKTPIGELMVCVCGV